LKRISPACSVIAVLVAACDTATPRSPDAEAVAARTGGTFVGGVLCSVARLPIPLPDGLRESSGLALSGAGPALLWSHNDRGNQPVLIAIDTAGSLIRSVAVQGADLIDWEDMEAGPCESGTCLYIADIGDNDGIRESIAIYVVPELAESLFIHPTGDLFVITKGRPGPITLYRYPTPLRPDSSVLLERVLDLASEPLRDDDRATAASLSPDGRWLGMRTYRNLFIYDAKIFWKAVERRPLQLISRLWGSRRGRGWPSATTVLSGSRAKVQAGARRRRYRGLAVHFRPPEREQRRPSVIGRRRNSAGGKGRQRSGHRQPRAPRPSDSDSADATVQGNPSNESFEHGRSGHEAELHDRC